MMDDEGDHFETRVVQAGRRREWTQGLVNPPVYRASTTCSTMSPLCATHKAGWLQSWLRSHATM